MSNKRNSQKSKHHKTGKRNPPPKPAMQPMAQMAPQPQMGSSASQSDAATMPPPSNNGLQNTASPLADMSNVFEAIQGNLLPHPIILAHFQTKT